MRRGESLVLYNTFFKSVFHNYEITGYEKVQHQHKQITATFTSRIGHTGTHQVGDKNLYKQEQRLNFFLTKIVSCTIFFNLNSYALGAGKLVNLNPRAGYPERKY